MALSNWKYESNDTPGLHEYHNVKTGKILIVVKQIKIIKNEIYWTWDVYTKKNSHYPTRSFKHKDLAQRYIKRYMKQSHDKQND